VRRDWEASVAKRLKDYIYRATTPDKKGQPKPCPIWIPEDIYAQLLARRRQKGFKEKSKKFQQNRCSGGKDGKAPATHTMGRRNAIRMLDDMVNLIVIKFISFFDLLKCMIYFDCFT
jgi:hypothetical protein